MKITILFWKEIKKVAKYDESKMTYETPTVALNLTNIIKQLLSRLRVMTLRNGCLNESERYKRSENIKHFLDFLDEELKSDINKVALRNYSKNKAKKSITAEFASDEEIGEFNDFIVTLLDATLTEFKCMDEFDKKLLIKLSELTLLRLLIFNKKKLVNLGGWK